MPSGPTGRFCVYAVSKGAAIRTSWHPSLIADELNLDVNVVRNYFGGRHFDEGGCPAGIHIESGPDGGVVTLDDTSILECAMRIIAENAEA